MRPFNTGPLAAPLKSKIQVLSQLINDAKVISQSFENSKLELEAASEELSKRVLMSHQQSADLETQNHNLETTISQVKELLDLETSMKANIEKTWKECSDRAEKRLEESSIPLLQAAKDEVRADAILEEAMESWTAKRAAHRTSLPLVLWNFCCSSYRIGDWCPSSGTTILWI